MVWLNHNGPVQPFGSEVASNVSLGGHTYNVWEGNQSSWEVTNTGSAPLSSWQLGWTFPGNQAINNLWNGSYTQSGGKVSVTNESYNGTLAPGASTTVGFTATYSGSNTAPSAVSCT